MHSVDITEVSAPVFFLRQKMTQENLTLHLGVHKLAAAVPLSYPVLLTSQGPNPQEGDSSSISLLAIPCNQTASQCAGAK